MGWGWLKKAGQVGLGVASVTAGAHPVVRAVLAAVNAIEMISSAKGKDKENAAVNAVPSLLASMNLGTRLDAPGVQDAIRKTMQAYVAAQNVDEAARQAWASFEEAKAALEAVIADVKNG